MITINCKNCNMKYGFTKNNKGQVLDFIKCVAVA